MSQLFRVFGPQLVMLIPFVAVKFFIDLFQLMGLGGATESQVDKDRL